MAEGLILRLTHTGSSPTSIIIDDLVDDSAERIRPGPLYVPVVYVPQGGSVELVLTSSVANSFESGTIRSFINSGDLTAIFILGSSFNNSVIAAFAALFDAQTILVAVADDTPAAEAIGDGEFAGRPV